jgi:hypothetical protein
MHHVQCAENKLMHHIQKKKGQEQHSELTKKKNQGLQRFYYQASRLAEISLCLCGILVPNLLHTQVPEGDLGVSCSRRSR